MMEAVVHAPFAIAVPAGIEIMDHSTQAVMEGRPYLAWVQLDFASTFVELRRKKLTSSAETTSLMSWHLKHTGSRNQPGPSPGARRGQWSSSR